MRLLDSSACHDLLILDIAIRVFRSEGFSTAKECAQYLRDGTLGLYAVEFKGQLVGCVFLSLGDGRVWLRGLYVDPEYRRRGIGTWLAAVACQRVCLVGHDFVYVLPPNKKMAEFFTRTGLFWGHSEDKALKGFSQYRVPSLDVKF